MEQDPILITFDQVAVAAGVSRALIHAYVGDRRGLIDAVQVRIVGRMDTWVSHGLNRAEGTAGQVRAMTVGLAAFVEGDHDAWNVLITSGGLDHPALHGVRNRWTKLLAGGRPEQTVAAQAVVAALIFGMGGWVSRGIEPAEVIGPLLRTLR